MNYLILAILILVLILVGLLVLIRRTPTRADEKVEPQDAELKEEGPELELQPAKGDEAEEAEQQFELDFLNDAGYFRNYIDECLSRVFSGHDPKEQSSWQPMTAEDVGQDLNSAIISSLSKLKNFGTAHKTLRVMDDPDVGMYKISEIIVTDPILSAEVLRVANSAFFGARDKVQSIHYAIMVLGIVNLKKILYHYYFFGQFDKAPPREKVIYHHLWNHVSLTSLIAAQLSNAWEDLDRGTLFTAGLLHDLGKFIILSLVHEYFYKDATFLPYFERISLQDEEENFGLNHQAVGQIACSYWDLPRFITKVVGHHHAPGSLPREAVSNDESFLKYLAANHIANQLSNALIEGKDYFSVTPLHPSYLDLVDIGRATRVLTDNAMYAEMRKFVSVDDQRITGVSG
jgi:HD-like signal output (HDOD) protein